MKKALFIIASVIVFLASAVISNKIMTINRHNNEIVEISGFKGKIYFVRRKDLLDSIKSLDYIDLADIDTDLYK